MSQATKDFFDWHHAYWEHQLKAPDDEQLATADPDQVERFYHLGELLIGCLPIVLEPIAIEATKAAIDPSPIINLSCDLPRLRQKPENLELMLDAVLTVVKRLELLEGVEIAKTQHDDPNGKRDSKRDKSEKFVPYEHCLRDQDEDVRAAAAELNRIGRGYGKTAALRAFFDGIKTTKTTKKFAMDLVKRMKKIEQRGRKQAGQ